MNYRFTTSHFPSLVGFDRLFNQLDQMVETKQSGYPPYNVKRTSDTQYQIDVAVAGFNKDEIDIELKENTLHISAKRQETEDSDVYYIHRGLANRSFSNAFTLADDVIVKGADIVNGILSVKLERIIPEEKRPRKIPIGLNTVSTDKQLLTE